MNFPFETYGKEDLNTTFDYLNGIYARLSKLCNGTNSAELRAIHYHSTFPQAFLPENLCIIR